MKKDYNMKTFLQIISGISILVSVWELWQERTEGAILFLLYAFYLKYNSDQLE